MALNRVLERIEGPCCKRVFGLQTLDWYTLKDTINDLMIPIELFCDRIQLCSLMPDSSVLATFISGEGNEFV